MSTCVFTGTGSKLSHLPTILESKSVEEEVIRVIEGHEVNGKDALYQSVTCKNL